MAISVSFYPMLFQSSSITGAKYLSSCFSPCFTFSSFFINLYNALTSIFGTKATPRSINYFRIKGKIYFFLYRGSPIYSLHFICYILCHNLEIEFNETKFDTLLMYLDVFESLIYSMDSIDLIKDKPVVLHTLKK